MADRSRSPGRWGHHLYGQPDGDGRAHPTGVRSWHADILISAPGTAYSQGDDSSPAPAGGVTIALSSANTFAATVPQSVTIPQSSTTATFLIEAIGSITTVVSIQGNARRHIAFIRSGGCRSDPRDCQFRRGGSERHRGNR